VTKRLIKCDLVGTVKSALFVHISNIHYIILNKIKGEGEMSSRKYINIHNIKSRTVINYNIVLTYIMYTVYTILQTHLRETSVELLCKLRLIIVG